MQRRNREEAVKIADSPAIAVRNAICLLIPQGGEIVRPALERPAGPGVADVRRLFQQP